MNITGNDVLPCRRKLTKPLDIKLMASAFYAGAIGFFQFKDSYILPKGTDDMLAGFALIMLLGMITGGVMKKLGLPPLIGMILTGAVIGPYAFDLIDSSIMDISPILRKAALVVILTRAGLTLDTNDLKKAGRPALLMCFLPACAEIAGTALIAPMIFGISLKDALVMGSVLAAVSPAVVVPRMIKLIEEGVGAKNKVPQIILAGASADDILVIVLFSVFTSFAAGETGSAARELIGIPESVLLGAIAGVLAGMALKKAFDILHIRDTYKAIAMLSVSFLLLQLEDIVYPYVRISALIAITAAGLTVRKTDPELSGKMASKYNKLWAGAEILLFVLVGAEVRLSDAAAFGAGAVFLVMAALLFRMAGVALCMIKTDLTGRERLFCALSYLPKATVQASIGSVPLAIGLPCGRAVLTCAVLSILITAPLGALCIDKTSHKLLAEEE